jgi:hypothetical protein
METMMKQIAKKADERPGTEPETISDLTVTDEQAGSAKGGGDDRPTETVSFYYNKTPSPYRQ